MKKWTGVVLIGLMATAAQAEKIVVSWVSNGVLMAEGMEPGSTGVVEAVSNLGEIFTNAATFFDTAYVADSNGMVHVAVPMFFRVSGTPATPEGMVLIPAGTNSGTDPDFGVYSLTNETAFYMDKTEVTKAQWDTVYNWAVTHGYSFSNAGSDKGADHPVHTVNWYDCVKWCNARSEMNGKTPCYTISNNVYKTGESTPDCDLDAAGYRLPTSDEWEYAARGGLSDQRFPWGDTITHSEANYWSTNNFSYDISPTRGYHPDYDEGPWPGPYTSPVGAFAANGYGLYDMSGNVYEWCTDWHPDFEGSIRVMRGGSWAHNASYARCGLVGWDYPYNGRVFTGLRAVLPVN